MPELSVLQGMLTLKEGLQGSQYPFPLQWTDGSDTPMDPSVESFQMDNGGATTYKTLENMVKTWRALLLISSPC